MSNQNFRLIVCGIASAGILTDTVSVSAQSMYIERRVLCTAPHFCNELAKLSASDVHGFDGFAESVSIDGDKVVVGAINDNCAAGSGCGAAYVYRLTGSDWVEEAKLTASDGAAYDAFGGSVAISGEVVVVGASGDDCAGGQTCGAAYLYRFTGTVWVEEAKLVPSNASPGEELGRSVAISGDVAVVGASLDDCAAGSFCGAAYAFRFDGSNWVEEGKLSASDADQWDFFGVSVSITGDVAVVGAYGDDCAAGPFCGAAYVFRFDGNNWVEEAKLTTADPAGSFFGFSVSISNDVVVIGAFVSACAAGQDCGAAYVFRFDGNNWVEEAKLTVSDAAAGDKLGYSVSLSGDVALVGAPYVDCPAGTACGASYVYRFDGSIWVEEGKLGASDAGHLYLFGHTVSVRGDLAVVGAPRDVCPGRAAYVFAAGPSGADCDCDGRADACEFASGEADDCNGNNIPDECDLVDGTTADCNNNSIPDDCEPDCNGNSVADSCDIAAHTSLDCTDNGIPDECEPDCNANEVPDSCDIIAQTSDDCNANAIPDECEPDCNANGVADSCDIADGPSEDCNGNRLPDECDIAVGGSEDSDSDDVPDECESTTDPFFALVPVLPPASVGPYPPGVSVIGNEVFLPAGGGRVWLEIKAGGWGQLCRWGATVDSSGYATGSGDPLAPATELCDEEGIRPDDPCENAFGPASTCDNAFCLAGFQDFGRSDFVIHSAVPFVDTCTLDYAYGSVQCLGPWCFCTGDEGRIHYGGTLVLDVPCDARGTYTIGFDPDWTAIDNWSPPTLSLGSARITVGNTEGPDLCCMPSGACTPLAPACCQAAQGVIVQSGLVCEGDVDQDGLDGVCGDGCPDDPDKTEPGLCGCGVLENPVDTDGDGVADRCGAIPAVSEWGLVVFGLLLLTAATICIGRHQRSQQQPRARS